jgi:hypothetical protein
MSSATALSASLSPRRRSAVQHSAKLGRAGFDSRGAARRLFRDSCLVGAYRVNLVLDGGSI